MRLALSIPATFLGGSLAVLSVAANFYFGSLLSTGEERWLYAFLFAVLDCCKTFLLPWRDAFLETGEARKARWALLAFVVFAFLSFWAEFGLYKTIKDRNFAQTTTASTAVDLISAPLNEARESLKGLASTRARAEIERDIADKEINALWRRSKSCKDVSLDDSREFCRTYNALTAERTRFDDRKALQDKIGNLSQKLLEQASNGTLNQSKTKDTQAVSIADLVGLPAPTVSNILGLIIAFLVEMGSILLPWFACSKAKECPIPTIPDVPSEAPAPPALPEPVMDDATPGERAAQAWYDACVVRRRGGFVLAAELGDNHEGWCAGQKLPSMDKTTLGRFMRKRGHVSEKKSGAMRYEGIALVPAGKPQLRLAVSNSRLGPMAVRVSEAKTN
jgi:hypothetical protein